MGDEEQVRFWVFQQDAFVDASVQPAFPFGPESTWGVVDEEACGIIAYFPSRDLANAYATFRTEPEGQISPESRFEQRLLDEGR